VRPAGLRHRTKRFDGSAFDAAQAAGKSILVEVTAPWCPTCKAQKPIREKLGAEKKVSSVVAFTIDFDSKKDLLRKFNVRMQGTLIRSRANRKSLVRPAKPPKRRLKLNSISHSEGKWWQAH
jgi:thiol-disulfide isomerase/thioredoxin